MATTHEPNTTCRVCGKKYFACMRSRELGGYRMVACSPDCYKLYQIDVMIERGEKIPDEWKAIAEERKKIQLNEQKELQVESNIELAVIPENESDGKTDDKSIKRIFGKKK